jgi:Ca-activated chloride channel family protein
MTWGHPELLWTVPAAVALLALFLAWSWRRRRALVARFVPARLQQNLAPGISLPRYAARGALLAAGLAALLLALARPRLGVTETEARQRGLDVLVAVDVSKSMLAQDGGGGMTRLGRAKLAVLDLVRAGPADRFGLIAFAGTAFLQSPLTYDDEAFRQSVEALSPDILPQGGTALAAAIRTALDAARDREGAAGALVIFTDGENHEPGAAEAAQAAAAAGLRIFTVGVGTPRGEVIQLPDADGHVTYLRDQAGNVVKSALNEPLLQEIAGATRGFYVPLQDPRAMALLYERGLAPLPRLDAATRRFRQFSERFQWPLAAALALLALEALLPEQRRRRGRVKAVRLDHPTMSRVGASALVLGLAGLALAAGASPGSAYRAYQRGDYEAARAEYEALAAARTNDLRLRFNAGAAAFKAGEFEDAERHFAAATQAPEVTLQKDAWRNLADAAYFRGFGVDQDEQKRRLWQESLKRYDTALKLDPADPAARHNREFVRRAIEKLPPPPKQPQSPSGKPDQQEDNQPDRQEEQPPQQQQQDQASQDGQPPQPDQPDNAPDEAPEGQQPESEDSGQRQQGREQPEAGDSQAGQPDQPQDGRQPSPQSQAGEQGGAREGGTDAADGEQSPDNQLTPRQALRLLDTALGEEQLIPADKPRARQRVLKDW